VSVHGISDGDIIAELNIETKLALKPTKNSGRNTQAPSSLWQLFLE
jgi:hypothetical protein